MEAGGNIGNGKTDQNREYANRILEGSYFRSHRCIPGTICAAKDNCLVIFALAASNTSLLRADFGTVAAY